MDLNNLENATFEDISFAPMEGVTGPIFRKIHKEHFSGVDRYFTPFLAANQNHHFKRRETREYLPYDPHLVPQILTSSPEDFIWAAKTLKEAGYKEVNLNIGCPMATVVTKKKGAGLLLNPSYLNSFFEKVFEETDMPDISIKTRLGFSEPEEAKNLGKLFSNYPFSEVIIHARVREDFYTNPVNYEAFGEMADLLSCPVCYNGDIRTVEDAIKLKERFPKIKRIMIGRGLLANPALAGKIREYEKSCSNGTSSETLQNSSPEASPNASLGTSQSNPINTPQRTDHMQDPQCPQEQPSKEELRAYLDDLWRNYSEELSGERDILFKMKELWFHLGVNYPEHKKALETIRKCKTSDEYHRAVKEILF